MQDVTRRYFQFTRLYRSIYESLPSPEAKEDFMRALMAYGFDQTAPDFGDNETLQRAWGEVFPDLCYSWQQRDTGARGGRVTQARRTGKQAKPGKGTNEEPPPPPTPPATKPTPEFVESLKAYNLAMVATAPKPINLQQWEYLCKVHGPEYVTQLIIQLETQIRREGAATFWETREKSVFELLDERARKMTEAFKSWIHEAFPRVASMQPHPLTLGQYLVLSSKYGRANILTKLKQLNDMAGLNKHVRAFDVVELFIKRSIKQGEGHRFGLPRHDDNPTSEKVPEVSAGYDRAFSMKVNGVFTFGTVQE